MTFDLAQLRKPMTRAQALAAGELVDSTAPASFAGFNTRALVSREAWAEVVGDYRPELLTGQEFHAQAARLAGLWTSAIHAVARAARDQPGANLHAVAFHVQGARDRRVPLLLVHQVDGTEWAVVVQLRAGR